MVFIDQHFENPEKPECLEELQKKNAPCILSLIPTQSVKYSNYIRTLLRAAANRKNVIIGQQGKTHWCLYTKEREFVDPCHENFCFNRYSKITVEQQRKIMGDGKKILEDLLQRSPEMYVPPNHMFDEDTIRLADEMNYKFFADTGIVITQPYRRYGLIMIPEIKADFKSINKKSLDGKTIYFHNDRPPKNFDEIIRYAEDVRDLPKKTLNLSDDEALIYYPMILLNNFLKNSSKKLRDINRVIHKKNDYTYETSPAKDHEIS